MYVLNSLFLFYRDAESIRNKSLPVLFMRLTQSAVAVGVTEGQGLV